jgi:uncharacterized protein (TIGR04255 family)
MNKLPRKLKKDALVEVLFEVRFSTSTLPEVFIGKLIAAISALESGMLIERLPMADVPAPIRKSDPNFAYQPTIQIKNKDGNRIARISEMAASWHAVSAYPGWPAFRKEIEKFNKAVAGAVEGTTVERFALRYLNFLNAKDHNVRGLADVTIDVMIGKIVLDAPLNVQYQRTADGQTLAVRVATPEYVQPGRTDFSLFIDLDVYSKPGEKLGLEQTMKWVKTAHTSIKQQFFTLLKPEVLQSLVEES